MIAIVGIVLVLAFFIIGVLVGASLTHHWMSRRIHTVGAERRELSVERADAVDAWTELELMRRPIDG